MNCTSLALTSLPDGITSIGPRTFEDCASLALISLPDGLVSIGDRAFYGCPILKPIWDRFLTLVRQLSAPSTAAPPSR